MTPVPSKVKLGSITGKTQGVLALALASGPATAAAAAVPAG